MSAVTIAAVYTFCAHYHSGQWSRLYRILCAADRAWRRHAGIEPRLDYWEHLVENEPGSSVAKLYAELVEKHG